MEEMSDTITTDGLRVLLVDDDVNIRRILNAVLTQEGVDVVAEAGDGERAISLTEQLHPQAVVMDLMMPVLDGAAAAREISGRWPSILVVGLTAGNADARERLQAAGAHVVFDKTEIVDLAEWLGQQQLPDSR